MIRVMAMTTPPRPVDVTSLFPELREHSATTTRLHPRPGAPTTADSSVGGPLLWPADEPWPVCTDGDIEGESDLETPPAVRRIREIIATALAREAASGSPYRLTEEESAEMSSCRAERSDHLTGQPVPLIPVAQLYRRDVPDFAGPDDADLLQVLWCGHDHADETWPRVRLYWRRSAGVTRPLEVTPEPPLVLDSYLPVACIVEPEQVREYQYCELLPEDLRERISEWEEEAGEPAGYSYGDHLSVAPGWKVGGFAGWNLFGPRSVDCDECGTAMTLLFTSDLSEWDPEGSWRPVQEAVDAESNPTGVTIGRGYSLYVFRCPASHEHPHVTVMA